MHIDQHGGPTSGESPTFGDKEEDLFVWVTKQDISKRIQKAGDWVY